MTDEEKIIGHSAEKLGFDLSQSELNCLLELAKEQQQLKQTPESKSFHLSSAAPLGLGGFCLSVVVLSLCNIQVGKTSVPNIAVGLSFFYGGLAEFVAGILLFCSGDLFFGVVFGSYSTFWFSWAAINIPWFGIADAYADDADMFGNAQGLFLIGWFFYTLIIFVSALRTTVFTVLMFFLLDMTFLLLAIGAFTANAGCNKAGGFLGLFTGIVGWYLFYGMIASHQKTLIPFKDFKMPF